MPRILVIDDSPSALQSVEMTLVDAGYQVVACRNGKTAVERMRRESFDLIITDIYMPEEDGLEVMEQGRQICPDVPIMAMSGVTGPRSMLAVAKHLGARRVLQKPFSKAVLLRTVEAVLRGTPHSGPLRK